MNDPQPGIPSGEPPPPAALAAGLPSLMTQVPGPRSLEMAARLARAEGPGVTWLDPDGRFPVFWERAAGSNVWDVDGNRYLDGTSAFGVAAAGHAHPELVRAASEQAATLMHGMGDVHPPRVKLELLERLAELAPGELGGGILGLNGADAVEAALKLAWLHTDKPGVVAFEGGYHGLLGLSLEAVGHARFRKPFDPLLAARTTVLPYPAAQGWRERDVEPERARLRASLDALASRLTQADAPPVGAVVVEPMQARGGEVVPARAFLPGVRALCDAHGAVLIADEIYTGFGRTGERFACDHEGVRPDVMTVGKALTGGFPLSACLARPEIMASWPRSEGEALHTSTFLGHPVACAVALRALDLYESLRLPLRAERAGQRALARLRAALAGCREVTDVRGRGLLLGVELGASSTGAPAAALALEVTFEALRRGYLVLPSGVHGNVIGLSPPLTTPEPLLDALVDGVAECIEDCARRARGGPA